MKDVHTLCWPSERGKAESIRSGCRESFPFGVGNREGSEIGKIYNA